MRLTEHQLIATDKLLSSLSSQLNPNISSIECLAVAPSCNPQDLEHRLVFNNHRANTLTTIAIVDYDTIPPTIYLRDPAWGWTLEKTLNDLEGQIFQLR